MPSPASLELDRHTADWDEDTSTLTCSCEHPGGYVHHIAALLGTDEAGAREALLAAHENTPINTGMCGGCATCGIMSAAVHCPVCGDADYPCLTYYVSAGRGPTDEPTYLGGSK